MLSDLPKLGIGGMIGLLIGMLIGLYAFGYVNPTTPGGAGIVLALPMIVGLTLGAIASVRFKKQEADKGDGE